MIKGRAPLPVSERLARKTEYVGECWTWTGSRNKDGYGLIQTGSRTDGSRRLRSTHRVSYEEFVGEIPDGLEIDHTCHQRACWNPDHLRVVTHAVNCHWDSLSDEGRVAKTAWARELAKLGSAARRAA